MPFFVCAPHCQRAALALPNLTDPLHPAGA